MIPSAMSRKAVPFVFWLALLVAVFLPFGVFLSSLWRTWLKDSEFSYGMLIPGIAAYLLWVRRERLRQEAREGNATGAVLVVIGCGLEIIGSLSGTLLVCGIAFVATLFGIVLYLWGPACLRLASVPLGILILMVPMPSYATGQLSWRLQSGASSVSSVILRFLSVPVYQDGNLLNLPNYVLEVKQVCSGSRFIFALLVLAVILGLSVERKWWARFLLIMAALLLAVCANILRIVGTGLIATRWGSLAANESLHSVWGIVVFLSAVGGLLGFQRFLQWTNNEYA